jgi:hypothetical protein
VDGTNVNDVPHQLFNSPHTHTQYDQHYHHHHKHTADDNHVESRRHRRVLAGESSSSSSSSSSGAWNVTADPNVLASEEEAWWRMEVTDADAFDAIRNDHVFLRKLDIDDVHSCYEYKVVETMGHMKGTVLYSNTFCYPAIIITGMRKCSTSALYALFSKHPEVTVGEIKENCAFVGQRSIIEYFDSLPKTIELGQFYVDGCVDLAGNMFLRKMLREPNTFYIVSSHR